MNKINNEWSFRLEETPRVVVLVLLNSSPCQNETNKFTFEANSSDLINNPEGKTDESMIVFNMRQNMLADSLNNNLPTSGKNNIWRATKRKWHGFDMVLSESWSLLTFRRVQEENIQRLRTPSITVSYRPTKCFV